MPVIACKLPAGLTIRHHGASLTLVGANIGEDIENVSRNGSPNDNARRSHGFGLTEVTDSDAKLFADWANSVTYKNGKVADGKLAQPFVALENGSILGPFGSFEEARKECGDIASAIKTGFEGLEPEKEGIEDNEEANKGASSRKK